MASKHWYENRDIAKRHHGLMAATHRQHALDAAAYGNDDAMDHHLNMESLHSDRLRSVNAEIMQQQDADAYYDDIHQPEHEWNPGESDDWDPSYRGHRSYGEGEESDAFHQ